MANYLLLVSVDEDRQQLILIGNAPSSGSTLLADLIDSAPFAACGPELEFFCNRALYDFKEFRKNPKQKSNIATLRATGIYPRMDHLHAYGHNESSFYSEIGSSESLQDFTNKFTKHFLSHRSKPVNGFVFEKTPQNSNAIDLFLNAHPNNHFVYVVRHPLYVIDSLLRRGWGTYTSAASWLVNVSLFWTLRKHPNIRVIKYEELVENPYKTVADLVNGICSGYRISPEELHKEYINNDYRKNEVSHLESWSTGQERAVRNANKKEVSLQAQNLFHSVLGTRISSHFANTYRVPQLSVKEAMNYFGYDSPETLNAEPLPSKNAKDLKKLSAKTVRYLLRNQPIKTSLAHFRALDLHE